MNRKARCHVERADAGVCVYTVQVIMKMSIEDEGGDVLNIVQLEWRGSPGREDPEIAEELYDKLVALLPNE